MLREENIAIQIKSQGYESKTYMVNQEGTEAVLVFESSQRSAEKRCPVCGQCHLDNDTRVVFGREEHGYRNISVQTGTANKPLVRNKRL